jgi:hypothetical protein
MRQKINQSEDIDTNLSVDRFVHDTSVRVSASDTEVITCDEDLSAIELSPSCHRVPGYENKMYVIK